MLWALMVCAIVGFALGTQCRLIPLAAATALIAAVVMVAPPSAPDVSESAASPLAFALGGLVDFGSTFGVILVLIVTLQAFFLAGAVWRVCGPRFPLSESQHSAPEGGPAARPAHLHAAAARDTGRDTRID